MPIGRYITIADVRAEGPPYSDATTYNDAWVQEKIDLASEQIETFTGQWFTSIERAGVSALKLNGNGANFLPFPCPIICIDTITLIYAARYGADPTYAVEPEEVIVYNRHLTEGLTKPDDRKNPGMSIEAFLAYPKEDLNIWPRGDQNVQVEGKFGWTALAFGDTVGETVANSQIPKSEGSTPLQIKRACMLLVRRAFPKVGDFHGMMGTTKPIGDITEMKARDQFIRYAEPAGGGGGGGLSAIGGTTGDPEVDRILLNFRVVPSMGWA